VFHSIPVLPDFIVPSYAVSKCTNHNTKRHVINSTADRKAL